MSKKDFWEGYVPEPVKPSQKALDKMAENARELGLDYEPLTGTQISKVWWDGEKLMAKPIPLIDIYKTAQQEAVCQWQREDDDHMPDTWRSDCGVLWTFSDGGPVDNEMKYCCGCGAMLLEKKK